MKEPRERPREGDGSHACPKRPFSGEITKSLSYSFVSRLFIYLADVFLLSISFRMITVKLWSRNKFSNQRNQQSYVMFDALFFFFLTRWGYRGKRLKIRGNVTLPYLVSWRGHCNPLKGATMLHSCSHIYLHFVPTHADAFSRHFPKKDRKFGNKNFPQINTPNDNIYIYQPLRSGRIWHTVNF